jgi:hypothetical protein
LKSERDWNLWALLPKLESLSLKERMPWNWDELLQSIPEEKRMHLESLHIQADMLGPLPTIERKAMKVTARHLDSVFLKAFEETYDTFDLKKFESRLNRLKNQCGNAFESYLVYFPGVNLYIGNGETGDHICHFRISSRT